MFRILTFGFSAIAALFCLLISLTAGGCNVIGAAAYVAGPMPVKARYVPENVPMLVLAEDYDRTNGTSLAAEQLEQHVMAELIRRNIAPVAQGDALHELRAENPEKFRSMSIVALGRLAGAQQVLYITTNIQAADVAPGANMLKGQATAHVRVVDVTTGQTLWPTNESRGYPVEAETPFVYGSSADPSGVHRTLQQDLADQIVKLFYTYKPD